MNFQILYETIIESNLINFLIVVYFLVFIFKKFKLGMYVDSITHEIKNNVEVSYDSLKKAIDDCKKAEDEAKKLPFEKEKIINLSKENAKKMIEKASLDLEAKKKNMDLDLEKAKNAIFNSKFQKTTQSAQDMIYNVSFQTIKNMLDDETQKKIIFEALDELDNFSINGGIL